MSSVKWEHQHHRSAVRPSSPYWTHSSLVFAVIIILVKAQRAVALEPEALKAVQLADRRKGSGLCWDPVSLPVKSAHTTPSSWVRVRGRCHRFGFFLSSMALSNMVSACHYLTLDLLKLNKI